MRKNRKRNVEKYGDQDPYLKTRVVTYKKEYNPNYGDDRICKCGHPYYRHFDTYENMMNVGCKYCDCIEFIERQESRNVEI